MKIASWWRDAKSESPRLPPPEPRRSTHVILSDPFKIPPTSLLIRSKRHSRRVAEKIGKWKKKKWWWTSALMKIDRNALQIINTRQIFDRWMNPHRSGTSGVFAAIVYSLLLSKKSLPWPVRKEKLKKTTADVWRPEGSTWHRRLPGTKHTKTPYSNHVASKQGANYHLISLHHELFSRAVAAGTKDLRSPQRRHPAPPSWWWQVIHIPHNEGVKHPPAPSPPLGSRRAPSCCAAFNPQIFCETC